MVESRTPLSAGLEGVREAVRRYLLKQISVTITWMPSLHERFRGPSLTVFFRAATFCGEEEFYFLAVPVYMWFFDTGNGIALVLLFAFNLYLGNWLKNWFCLPRPPLHLRWDMPHRTYDGDDQGLAASALLSDKGAGCASMSELDDLSASCEKPEHEHAKHAKLSPMAAEARDSLALASGGAAAGCEAASCVDAMGGKLDAWADAHADDPAVRAKLAALAPSRQAQTQSGNGKGAKCTTRDEAELACRDVDFGWPSTHSMNAVALPFYLLRCAFPIAVWEYPEPGRMWLFGLGATAWAISVALSRVYLGVHSPADVQGGMMLGAVVLRLWLSVHRSLTALIVSGQLPYLPLPPGAGPGPALAGGGSAWPGRGLSLQPGSSPAAEASSSSALQLLLLTSALSVLLVLVHPVVQPRNSTFLESVMVVGFAFGFVVGAHLSGGNAAAPSLPEHAHPANVALCVLTGGLIIGFTKWASRRAALEIVGRTLGRRAVHGLLLSLPVCAFLRSLALVDVPANLGLLFTGMCAVVCFLEVGGGAKGEKGGTAGGGSDSGEGGCAAFGGESADAVIAKFANYMSCGLALTAAVPAAFRQLGLR